MRTRLTVSRAGGARRGAVLPLVCVLITVLLGAAALAIDLGRLRYTAAEAQAAADAAALAAARAMQLQAVQASSAAPTAATAQAARNRAARAAAVVQTVTPKVYSPSLAATAAVPDASSWNAANAVEVTVRAPGRYMFAGALGLTAPTVTRRATAWIANVNTATCVHPITLPYSTLYNLGFPSPTPSQSAPDVTQAQLNQIAAWPPSYKTVVLVPPNENAPALHNTGRDGVRYRNYGNWVPADFSGGTASMAQFGDWAARRNCASARAEAKKAGLTVMPWTTGAGDDHSALKRVTNNMPSVCNFRSAASALCWSSPTATVAGVRTPLVYGDFLVDTTNGRRPITVRAVGELRVMCYYRASTNTCPDQPGYPGGWSTSYWPDTGYPEGTIIGIVEAPLSVDLTSTTVLGDIVTNVQRLVLVR